MMRLPHWSASALAAALFLSGCGGSEAATGTAAAQFCATWKSKLAQRESTCARASPDAIAAADAWSSGGCASSGRAVEAGRAVFDAGAAERCLAAVDALECGGPAAYEFATGSMGLVWPGPIPECQGVIAGRVALGGSCDAFEDCAEGYCDMSSACPGTCVPYQQVGQSCGRFIVTSSVGPGPVLVNACSPGLACAPPPGATDGSVCITPSVVGGPCPCEAALYCDTVSSTCQVPKTSGPCESILECARGYMCTDARCQPAGVLGDACDPSVLPSAGSFMVSLDSCAPGYACDPASRTCTAAPGPGASCAVEMNGTNYYLKCIDATMFVNGGCTCGPQPKADGQPCTTSAECLGRCDPEQHKCVPIEGACAL